MPRPRLVDEITRRTTPRKLDPDEEREWVARSKCDVNDFAEYAISDKQGNPIRQYPIHREVQAHLGSQENLLNLVEIPRDHGKTWQALIRLLWLIANNPEVTIKIVCEIDGPARKRLGWVKEQIEKNRRVQRIFPRLKPGHEWSKTQFIVERSDPGVEPTLEACGVTTGATGGRADEILFDDPVGRRNALTVPALKPVVIEAINNDWLNLLDPKNGRAGVVCTCWTQDDWIAHAKKSGAWNTLRRPVTGLKSPWPEKWGEPELQRQLQRIGSVAYKRGFELQPLSSDVVAIQPEWIRYWATKPDLSRLIIFNAYDLTAGVSTSKKADFFAGVTVGLDVEPPGTFYVLRAWHRRISILQQILAVISDAMSTRPEAIGIEAVQYQAVLPSLVEAVAGGAMPPIIPLKPRVGKEFRLALVSPQIEMGRVLFNPALASNRLSDPEGRGDLVGELTSFPLGAHDDLVDAWVYAMLLALDQLLAKVGDDSDDFDTPYREELGAGAPSEAVARVFSGSGIDERIMQAWG